MKLYINLISYNKDSIIYFKIKIVKKMTIKNYNKLPQLYYKNKEGIIDRCEFFLKS